MDIIKFISIYYVCSFGEATNLFIPFIDKTLNSVQEISSGVNLSKEQGRCFDFLKKHSVSLLFGDTGSGKSEIYFKLFEESINSGKSCILLLPEISLTPQMKSRLEVKFGSLVAIWHSKITKKQKEKILDDIREGRVRLVMGARSALFLPLKNLGLIVVDEEHDDSYKSNKRPRYNARDLAVYIGSKLGTRVVLGSATPSITSYKNYPYYRLKQSYFKSNRSYEFIPNQDGISPHIILSLQATLKNSRQAIVFLPTRANYKYLVCMECGEGIKCPFCSIGMSIHSQINALKCHYCNYTELLAKECPKCKSSSLKASRLGTAQVALELKEHFNESSIEQFDRDRVKNMTSLNRVLKDFNNHKIDVLVGTQMLSKGHDYHGVELVVILDIDTLLNIADFRSSQRALSLLLQVSGRVGRRGEGRVVIQSSNREFFERYLDDYESFLKDELSFCQDLYPPYKKLLKLLISHKDRAKGVELLEGIRSRLNTLELTDIEVVGFGEAPVAKIANRFRFQLLFSSSSAKSLIELAHTLNQDGIEIDMDPINFS
jgi:primosomal protein N' (replication factor Y)